MVREVCFTVLAAVDLGAIQVDIVCKTHDERMGKLWVGLLPAWPRYGLSGLGDGRL